MSLITLPAFKVTPETHPQLFYQEEAGGFKFWVRKFIPVKLQEIREDLYRDRYAEMHPEELVDGIIDDTKYDSWLRSREGDRATDRVDLNLLFIPQQALPPDFEREEWISVRQMKRAQGFFSSPLSFSTPAPNGSNGPTANAQASEQPSVPLPA